MTKIEKIKEELLKRINNFTTMHNEAAIKGEKNERIDSVLAQLRNLLAYIEVVEQEKEQLQGLDEAAREWSEVFITEEYREACNHGFRAGAEWVAGQGVSIDGEVIISHGNKTIEHRSRHGIQETTIPGLDILDIGDKVVVQIRKK